MRAWLVLLFLPLAGCVAEAPVEVPDVLPARVYDGSEGCPLTYPDGSPFDCEKGAWTEPMGLTRPSLADGWKCKSSWGEENVHTELYMTTEGAIGFYWEWTRWKDDGIAFQRLGFYSGREEGISLHVPYAEQGFVALPPQDADGKTVDMHNTFRQMRIWEKVGDDWVHPEDVTWLVSHYGGDSWLVVRLDWPDGPYYIDLNVADPEDDEWSSWGAPGFQGTIAGRQIIVSNQGNGIKYNGGDFQQERLELGSGICGATDT